MYADISEGVDRCNQPLQQCKSTLRSTSGLQGDLPPCAFFPRLQIAIVTALGWVLAGRPQPGSVHAFSAQHSGSASPLLLSPPPYGPKDRAHNPPRLSPLADPPTARPPAPITTCITLLIHLPACFSIRSSHRPTSQSIRTLSLSSTRHRIPPHCHPPTDSRHLRASSSPLPTVSTLTLLFFSPQSPLPALNCAVPSDRIDLPHHHQILIQSPP